MKKDQRKPINNKRQFLINELIKFGIYKKNNKHLYEWSMSELETEYIFNETNILKSSTHTGSKV
ncbi:Fur-regulated basic protein FbpA [Neobacillus drentensis]|uniref:Fur-regulated basic protein FbpA n=1 Tax=Neobacillus drentensis TaxID=220684 RepID=UPI002FFFE4A7